MVLTNLLVKTRRIIDFIYDADNQEYQFKIERDLVKRVGKPRYFKIPDTYPTPEHWFLVAPSGT